MAYAIVSSRERIMFAHILQLFLIVSQCLLMFSRFHHRPTDDNQIPTSGLYIRLADPREEPPKVFGLHLRTNLPRSVSRCRGNCGKTILPEQGGMLIKPFGITTWTGAKTGADKPKLRYR